METAATKKKEQEREALERELKAVKTQGMHTSEATREIKEKVQSDQTQDPLIETKNNPYHQKAESKYA